MKRRFLLPLALLLLAAMLLPCPVIAEDLSLVSASAVDEINNPNVDLQPEELPEFQLDAPDADDSDTEHTAMEVAVMAAPADESNVESASADVPKAAVPTKLTLGVKEKYALKVSGAKKYASSNKQIATVSNKGVIQGKKTGTAKITITYKSGKKTTVKVTVKAAPGKVTLNKKKATLNAGKTLQLKATLPGKTTSCKMTWSSSNKKVAKVDTKGKVTALKAGTANITVTTFNGKKATCTVTVKKVAVPSKVTIVDYFDETLDSIDLEINEEYELYASVTPENATTTLTWTSSDDYVASVSDDGVVTGIDEGEAIITVETSNGKKATCTVTVNSPTLSVDKTSITIENGGKASVIVTGDPEMNWTCYSDDKYICNTKWGDTIDDTHTYLMINAVGAGKATVTIEDENTGEKVFIKITVHGISGDIWTCIGEDIDDVNYTIDDSATLWKSEDEAKWYANKYMTIKTSDSGIVNSIYISFGNKYNLFGIYPGMSLYSALYYAKDNGWAEYFTKGNTHYYRALLDGKNIFLAISEENQAVSSVMITFA